MSETRIAILGLGNIASGVVRILTEQAEMLTRRAGQAFDIRHVVVRDATKAREVEIASDVISTNWQTAVADDDVDIVVELIGGTTVAHDAVLAAIQNRKHVVTANKALLSKHGTELFAAAREANVCIAYEAAVAGGVPIIATLQSSMTSNQIISIEAILNGTSNFILTEMLSKSRTYADVLAEAQELGYAEADPSMDVDGTDAAQKLILLTQLVHGGTVDLAEFPRQGIDTLELVDMQYADEMDYRVKLLAVCRLHDDQLEMHVGPTLVRKHRAVAQTDGPLNIVELQGDAVGSLTLSGAGAGQMPTASAVVADMIGVATGRAQSTFPRLELWNQSNISVLPAEQIERRYYLRFMVEDRPHVMADMTDILGRNNISLATIIQHEAPEIEGSLENGGVPIVPLVFMTHRTFEGNLRAAEAELEQLSAIQQPYVRMPVAD
jgi:homoserine dehydrogenase